MYPIVMATARRETDGKNETLRRFARWEYGPGNADWLLAATRGLPVVAPARRRASKQAKPSLVHRLRSWIRPAAASAVLDASGAEGSADV
jgi:hypothetical protein